MPMLNVRSMSSSGTWPVALEPLEERRHLPRGAIDDARRCPRAACAAGCR